MTTSSKPGGESDGPLLPRLTTGNPQLDAILGGGFPANSINILMGEPGTGKTILAEHLMFANATGDGRPILFLTTLSEPLDKVVRYLQQFRFFDEEKLHASIVYDSLGSDLAARGVSVIVPRLKAAILEQQPKIIIIDSFKAIHDLSTSASEMRRMLYEVAGLLTASDTTAFFVGEYGPGQIAVYPEFAVADGIVELARNTLGTSDERFLRVLKMRGSQYIEGLHAFRIGPGGLEVSPRLLSPSAPPSYDIFSERVQTGIEGLDRMLDGGLYRGRSTWVLGPTGAGKTTFALQFVLEGIRRGEGGLYVSFQENPTQIAAEIAGLGMDPAEATRKGLQFLYVSPVELQIDSIIATIFSRIERSDLRRLGIDAIGDLVTAASDQRRLQSYLYALSQNLAVKGLSSLFIYETGVAGDTGTRLSALADNILLFGRELEGRRGVRTVRIVKARGIDHDLDVHEMRITGKGVEIF